MKTKIPSKRRWGAFFWGVGCLLTVGMSAQAQPAVQDATPWVGRWVSYAGGQPTGLCALSFDFTAEGRVEMISGGSRALARYAVAPNADVDGFWQMTSQFLEDNQQANCSGQVVKTGNQIFKSRVRTHGNARWLELCEGLETAPRCMVLWRADQQPALTSK